MKTIIKSFILIFLLSITFTFTNQSKVKAKSISDFKEKTSNAFFLNPPPSATFTFPTKDALISEHKTSVTVDIKAQNTAIVNKDLFISIFVSDSTKILGDEKTNSELIEDSMQSVKFSTTDEVKTLSFTNIPLLYSGSNYIGCAVYTADFSEFDLCGGFIYPDLIQVLYCPFIDSTAQKSRDISLQLIIMKKII